VPIQANFWYHFNINGEFNLSLKLVGQLTLMMSLNLTLDYERWNKEFNDDCASKVIFFKDTFMKFRDAHFVWREFNFYILPGKNGFSEVQWKMYQGDESRDIEEYTRKS